MRSTKTLDQYSTNPSTIKARRRKMKLDGANKVEDAAKTADYKAMVYARKVIQNKPEYKNATEIERANMLERAMHDTMEKRRARGQDTLSKMAAFRAGEYNLQSGSGGPTTNVPISQFLVNHGYIPETASRCVNKHNVDAKSNKMSPSTPEVADASTVSPFNPFPVAPMANMHEPESPSPYLIIHGVAKRGLSAPLQPSNGCISDHRASKVQSPQRSKSVLESHPPTPFILGTYQSIGPGAAPSSLFDPGMLPSIEQDDHNEIAALRHEVNQLQSMLLKVSAFSKTGHDVRDHTIQTLPPDVREDRIKIASLEKRLEQMEGIVQAMHQTSISNVMDRLQNLERTMDGLKSQSGNCCAIEVAKMKEVFGGLKESLVRVSDFI